MTSLVAVKKDLCLKKGAVGICPPNGAEYTLDKSEYVEVKPEINKELLMESVSDQDSDDSNEFGFKEKFSENSESDENSKEDFFQESYVGDQFQSVMVKCYTSVIVKEEPVENLKTIFKESTIQFERQKFHQQIFENIIKNSGEITLRNLQSQYLSELHQSAKIEIFTCTLCKYQTMNLVNLNCHLMAVHNRKMECEIFRCNVCNYEANFKSLMKKHMVRHQIVKEPDEVILPVNKKQKKEKFLCHLCTYEGLSNEKLRNHLSKHKDRSNCDLCSFQCNKNEIIQKHKETHKEGKSFKCYMCPYTNTNKATLGRHLLNLHKIANEASKRSKMCEICSFLCSSRHQLKVHHLTHQNFSELKEDEIFRCTECNYQTKYKSNYKLHSKIHKDPEFVCEICGFATRHRRSYNYHLITHKKPDEIDWFRCDTCPYQARNKKLLTQHIRRGDHSGKRLLHERNRDRLREAEEKGEPIEPIIRKYGIKKINGVPIKRERIVKPSKTSKRKRQRKRATSTQIKDEDVVSDEALVHLGFGEIR